jgi:hypothetical protein
MSLQMPFLVCALASCTKAPADQSAGATPHLVAESATVNQPATKPRTQTTAKRPASALRCGLKGSGTLGETGVGDLQVRRTIAAVKQSCLVVRDAVGPWIEGTTQRILTVVVGSETLYAAVDAGTVGSIAIRTPRFATADGLRVGTQLSKFISVKQVQMTEGEEGLYLRLPSHCGLAFHFSIQSRARSGMTWPPRRLEEQHGRATVDQIIVTKCVR